MAGLVAGAVPGSPAASVAASVADRPRVLVTRVLPGGDALDSPIARLRAATDLDLWEGADPPPPDVLRARLAGCDGVLTMITERIDATVLDAAPRLRVVSNLAAGFDNIDVPACTARGVLVTNTPGVVDEATADMAFALLLSAARRLPEGQRAIREGAWGQWHPTWLLGHMVSGATLGIVGPGRVARAVARRAHGFGMHVLYHGPREAPGFPGERVPLAELLARADFVSVHVPLTPETAGMCDAAFLRAMKPGAIFVNTSRGPIVDQDALIHALQTGEIAGAALDVMTPEPLPPDHPLLNAPHLVVAPHLGSATEETRAKMAHLAVSGLLGVLAREAPANVLNPDAAAVDRSAR